MTNLTTQEIIQIATKVADGFEQQADELTKSGDIKASNELLNRAIGIRYALNEIFKAINL